MTQFTQVPISNIDGMRSQYGKANIKISLNIKLRKKELAKIPMFRYDD